MIECPECDKQLSRDAEKCINCGHRMGVKFDPLGAAYRAEEIAKLNGERLRLIMLDQRKALVALQIIAFLLAVAVGGMLGPAIKNNWPF